MFFLKHGVHVGLGAVQ